MAVEGKSSWAGDARGGVRGVSLYNTYTSGTRFTLLATNKKTILSTDRQWCILLWWMEWLESLGEEEPEGLVLETANA